MVGWGIFLFIIGICFAADGGSLFMIAGIILFITGLVRGGTNPNTGDSVRKIKSKIDLIERFYQSLSNTDIASDKSTEYKNIISFYHQIKSSAATLNYKGVSLVNKEYDRISGIYNGLFKKINDSYETLNKCPLSFNFNDLKMLVEEAEGDLDNLLKIGNLLDYLLLISNNLNISRNGYEKFDTSSIGLPDDPQKIHIYAMSCFITKTIIDGDNELLFQSLRGLIDNVESDADLRKTLRKFYKDRLSELKKLYEGDEDDAVLGIILFIDPSSAEQYDKNNKFYEKLGLSKNATKEEIDKAYKKLLLKAHPDRGGDVQEWAKINEAYVKVKDLQKQI
jgi:hypothetical protein